MNRTTEFVLGLIGGIFGFGGAIFAIMFGVFDEEVSTLGIWALVFSISAVVGSVLVKFKPKIGGTMMLISGIGGLISISLFYVLPFVLLLIAGLMGLFRKEKKRSVTA